MMSICLVVGLAVSFLINHKPAITRIICNLLVKKGNVFHKTQ